MAYLNKFFVSLIFSFLIGMVIFVPVNAQPSFNDFQIVKMSPEDGAAVIRDSAGKITLVKLGDKVMGRYELAEVSPAMVVFEDIKSKIGEQIIIRFQDGKQSVERLTLLPEKENQSFNVVKTIR